MLIEIPIDNKLLFTAREEVKERLNYNSKIPSEKNMLNGVLGELIVQKYLIDNRILHTLANTYDYDFVIRQSKTYEYDIIIDGVLKAEVKTRSVKNTPREDYEVSLMAYNIQQKCNIYIFTFIKDDLTRGWIAGWKMKKDFLKQAVLYKAGSILQRQKVTLEHDCYRLEVNKLRSIEEFKD